jgi:hypothetical protein
VGNTLLNELKDIKFYFFEPQLEPEQVIANYLFNHPDHLLLQAKNGWKVFGLKVNGKAVLQLAIHVKGGEARSPLKAPFGSLQSMGRVSSKALNFFLKSVVAFLTETEGCKRIVIKSYPEIYQGTTAKLLYRNLAALGFEASAEISSIIGVDKTDFEKKIKISERQKLLKSKARVRFHEISILRLTEVYRFIETCRNLKNQSLSMTLEELQKTVKKFKNYFFLFGVSENDTLAAAAIVIRINKKILYTFYYAHTSPFNKISPTVFLLSGIYAFARQHHYQVLDLGTSMSGKEINKPLLHFKESVGGKPSPKYIFEKILA